MWETDSGGVSRVSQLEALDQAAVFGEENDSVSIMHLTNLKPFHIS